MSLKKLKERKERAKKMLKVFRKLYPNPKSELNYSNDWEFLVAVILSAQCTDKRVNEVTEKLFKKYKRIDDYVDVNIKEFEKDIFSTGFYRNKAKNIIASAKKLQEEYFGIIPKTIDEFIKFHGVGRKTANVVLNNLYEINEGIAVDTHVIRISRQFNLTDFKDAVRIEKDLMSIFPKKEWGRVNMNFVLYGRHICPAHKKVCDDELTDIFLPAKTKDFLRK